MRRRLIDFVRDERAQDLIEYALLAAVISVSVIGVVTAIGESLDTKYLEIAGALP